MARGKLDDAMGRAVVEQFFAAYMGEEARGARDRERVLHGEQHFDASVVVEAIDDRARLAEERWLPLEA